MSPASPIGADSVIGRDEAKRHLNRDQSHAFVKALGVNVNTGARVCRCQPLSMRPADNNVPNISFTLEGEGRAKS